MVSHPPQAFGTDVVTPLISVFPLIPIYREKVPNSKRRVLVPKYYTASDDNFLSHKTNRRRSSERNRLSHIFKPNNVPNDAQSMFLYEILAKNFLSRRPISPGIEMLKNVTGSDVVIQITM